MFELRPVLRASSAAAVAFLLIGGGLAQAATFSMTGEIIDRRGSINLPLPPFLGAPAPPILGSATVTQTGAAVPGGGPATITIPTKAFYEPPNLEGFLIPVPNVIQLTTSFLHSGPTTQTTLMASGGPGSFSFCPGATANPSCTTVQAGGVQGTLNGIVVYTAGPNKYGGTFRILLSGVGKLTEKGGALPPTTMTPMGATIPALPFSGVNGALGGTQIIAAGGFPLGSMSTGTISPSPVTHPLGYMTMTPKGLLTRGYTIMAGVSLSNQNTGFPLTTGAIYAYRTLDDEGVLLPEKLTASGYDYRSAAGAGRIQLVAGSMQRTFPTDGSAPPLGSNVTSLVLTMRFTPPFPGSPAVPIGSPAALVSLGSLVLLVAGYAVSRRSLR